MSAVTAPPPVVRGVCPVLATPFTDEGEVDFPSFRRLVDHVIAAGARSVMHPGFASEFHKLSDEERSELTAVLLESTRAVDDVTIVISIPDHATHLAARRATAAAAAGASAINLLPPYQLAVSAEAVREHVRTVVSAVAPTPVILQYAPAQTGTALDAGSISRMAQDAPNLLQVKVESTPPGPMITALSAQHPALTSVVGYAGVQLIDALRRGAVGVQPGSAFVEIYLAIWSAWEQGRQDDAIGMHSRLLPYTSYWMLELELLIAAEKRIAKWRGLIDSDHCRAPMRRLDAEEEASIDRFMSEFADELGS